jgi:hypothetical protein
MDKPPGPHLIKLRKFNILWSEAGVAVALVAIMEEEEGQEKFRLLLDFLSAAMSH